ncbi:MAG TPA: HEAT repeat domain-containing protein [Polyangia bacterium]|nr:HEAT repeat domain-containing protein [Polyangia bacterium]
MTRTTALASVSALLFCAAFAPLRAQAAPIAADKLPETPLAAPPGAEATYLATLHAHVHKRWADNFLRLIAEKLELSNPLNVPDRATEVDLVISGDGQLISSSISKSSGFPGFDDAVIEILHDAVPFPQAPLVVRSDDDNLRLHWVFARDQRRCSGVAVTRTYDPIAVSLPKLLHQGRRDEALNRVAVARNSGAHVEPQFTLLAIDWLKAALHEPWASVPMARTLALRGDQDAIKWLKSAVHRPESAADAGAALVAAKVPVCPLVKDLFDSQNWSDHQTAALALATAGESACVPGLAKLLENAKARPEARAAAAVALGVIEDPAAHKALVDATKDTNPMVHGAAMLAMIHPGAGRRGVFTVEVFLRDPSPDLRAAAAAGVVRAGGDANLADLYVLFKESDPRPALAALHELEHLKTEESTKLIQKLAHRPMPEVQKLAADILIRRNNRDSLQTLKPFLDPSTDPGLRGRALIVADDATLRAAATDPKLGIWVYRARLLNGQGDQAADWFVTYGTKLLPPAQMDAMAEWIAHTPAPAPVAAAPTTTAATH